MKSERVRGWLVHHKVNSLGSLSCPTLPSYFVKKRIFAVSLRLCGPYVIPIYLLLSNFFPAEPGSLLLHADSLYHFSMFFNFSYLLLYQIPLLSPVFAHHLNNDIITQPLTCFPTSLYCRLHDLLPLALSSFLTIFGPSWYTHTCSRNLDTRNSCSTNAA